MFKTTRSRARVAGAVFASAILLLGACEDDRPVGTLIVPFKLGNDRDCDEFKVERVYGELGDGEEHYDDVKCEARQLYMSQVPEGTYKIKLYGYDDNELAVMDSLSRDLSVNVIGGETLLVEPEVMLTWSPANLRLRWSFGFGSCKSAGIDRFLIDVWRADGSDLLLEATLDCDEIGDADHGFYRDVPDPERGLSGWAVGEVTIQALAKNGAEVGDPLVFEFGAPGPGRDIKLSFSCEEDECSCSGHPD